MSPLRQCPRVRANGEGHVRRRIKAEACYLALSRYAERSRTPEYVRVALIVYELRRDSDNAETRRVAREGLIRVMETVANNIVVPVYLDNVLFGGGSPEVREAERAFREDRHVTYVRRRP